MIDVYVFLYFFHTTCTTLQLLTVTRFEIFACKYLTKRLRVSCHKSFKSIRSQNFTSPFARNCAYQISLTAGLSTPRMDLFTRICWYTLRHFFI